MDNFELDCITWMYSDFWTHTTVISIYLTGAIVAGLSAGAAYIIYRSVRMQKGLLKLWLSWIYVIAINQSIGVFLRDIPFKRDIYHAVIPILVNDCHCCVNCSGSLFCKFG